MPTHKINGIQMYYDVQGDGEPLVMIQGLGYSSDFWFEQVPTLSETYRLVLFDNRDVGQTEKVNDEYSILDMAQDTRSLLDHLNIENAHILGLSMGGYIAQEFAINWPQRVNKLILISTHYGGPDYMEATEDLWEEILDVSGLSLEEAYRKGVRYAVTSDFFESNQSTVDKLVQMRLENPQPPDAFQRQFAAASNFASKERLDQIKAKTLVIAGQKDRIVPLKLARSLHQELPNSQIKIINNAAHLVHIEQPEEVNSAILKFLGD